MLSLPTILTIDNDRSLAEFSGGVKASIVIVFKLFESYAASAFAHLRSINCLPRRVVGIKEASSGTSALLPSKPRRAVPL